MAKLNREETIMALAKSSGLDQAFTKFHESRYEVSTGTLYCDGYAITSHTINKALKFFSNRAFECKKLNNPESQDMAMIYTVAVQAIKILTEKEEEA